MVLLQSPLENYRDTMREREESTLNLKFLVWTTEQVTRLFTEMEKH